MIRRKLLIILLTIGTVAGFGFGFRSLVHHRRGHRAALEQHVAKVCIEAARKSCPTAPAVAPPTVFVLPSTVVNKTAVAPTPVAPTPATPPTSGATKKAEAR